MSWLPKEKSETGHESLGGLETRLTTWSGRDQKWYGPGIWNRLISPKQFFFFLTLHLPQIFFFGQTALSKDKLVAFPTRRPSWFYFLQTILFDTMLILSPGQTDSQVDASFGLAFRLATHLRRLWSSSNLDASRRKFFTVWPPSVSRHKLIASNLLS